MWQASERSSNKQIRKSLVIMASREMLPRMLLLLAGRTRGLVPRSTDTYPPPYIRVETARWVLTANFPTSCLAWGWEHQKRVFRKALIKWREILIFVRNYLFPWETKSSVAYDGCLAVGEGRGIYKSWLLLLCFGFWFWILGRPLQAITWGVQ